MARFKEILADFFYAASHFLTVLLVLALCAVLIGWRLQHLFDVTAADANPTETVNSEINIANLSEDTTPKGFDIKVLIPEGTDLDGICRILFEANLITNTEEFTKLMEGNSLTDRVHFGTFQLNTTMTPDEIAATITQPPAVTEETSEEEPSEESDPAPPEPEKTVPSEE